MALSVSGESMTITLRGRARAKLRTDLSAHRQTFTLNDADYASEVLKVSLNTFKKCLQTSGSPALSLSRGTFVRIFANAELDPKDYGVHASLPLRGTIFGGYDKRDYKYLCGRYFLYRRTFLTGQNITCSIIEIFMNETKECLSFHEIHFYVSDSGVRDEQHYYGDIHLNQERTILSMPAHFEGQVRLTLVHMPQKLSPRETVKMRGALLAFGIPKGYWQPVLASVFIEGPITGRNPDLKQLCRTIRAGTDEFGRLSAELAHTETHSTINTAVMWQRAQRQAPSNLRAAGTAKLARGADPTKAPYVH